jgi:cell division protein ZapA (FtsZ GTPase activity inhibitor)
MKKSHAVTILNQKLVVRSDAGDETVEEIADLVSQRIQAILNGTKSASVLTAALLTCLNLAEELREHKKVHGVAGARAAQKIREIIKLIDHHADADKRIAL